MKYDHKKIEQKWQKEWEKQGLHTTPDSIKGKENFYLLVEFPYPSGNLHVGHWYAFAVPDILARHLRMKGKNVLYPIGFDAFGLPAENAAIKNKLNPRIWTEKNIEYMSTQIRSMGTTFDWSREVRTIDPAYYKWTQWMFLQFFKKGLVYQKETAVNWCPVDKTVLANEQVIDGHCERCGAQVEQRQMLQWNIKITDYADRLIDDLEQLNWPKEIKESQRNWIGRSEGAEIDFPLTIDNDKKYTYVILHGFTSSPDRPRFQYWKQELEKLGHTVIIPELPNTNEPSEDEQVATALAATAYDENTVLVGMSLGAVVAMKVVEKLKKPISRLVLAGGFVDRNFKDKPRNFDKTFEWKFDKDKIRKNAKTVQILHDINDNAISVQQLHELEKTLGIDAQKFEAEEPHFGGKKESTVLMWLRPTIRVFTTRPDTLFGATYLVLAPEHPWVTLALQHETVLKNNAEVQKYVNKAKKKTELERQANQKEKTGVLLEGVEAMNPANGEKIPLFVADYVLGHYGTGAIMAVPAHDERDYEFAKKFDLPIVEVIQPLIVNTKKADSVRESRPFKERNAIVAVIKHWKEDKYLCLQLKVNDWRGFVIGGIEDGEDAVAAAQREITEETGYTNPQFVRELGGTVHSKFFHMLKGENRFAHFTPLLFQLRDDEQIEVDEKEKEIHDLLWIDADKVDSFLNRDDMALIWNRVKESRANTEGGILINSGEFDGTQSEEAKSKIVEKVAGRLKNTYRLRDWIVSRQRYWGVPIPIIHCDTCGTVPVSDSDLPVLLPDVEDYLPTGDGKSPLAKVSSFVQVTCPSCGGEGKRETDTLDTFVDSSWYFLRYTDPKNAGEFAQGEKMDAWMPVDLYSGGAEHTTMHVLYSRFWQKALYDCGLVKDAEPYTRRMNRSLILGPDGQKMSKSRGNVIDPDEVVSKLGADTVRMYLAFIGPYNEVSNYPWNPDGVVGVRRFLERLARAGEWLANENVAQLDNQLHKTIKKVGDDIEALKFNTAISALMILVNAIEKSKHIGRTQYETLLRILAPFAPHLAEELWHSIGKTSSVHTELWPEYDPALLKDETVTMAIQINGKTRSEMEIATDSNKDVVEKAARDLIAARLEGREVSRVIVVPNRLINFVVQE
jgi:leucyl-tRNA synthetase